MVLRFAETKVSLKEELMDIKKILEFGMCSEGHKKYLMKRKQELEEKLKKYEGVSD